MGLTDKDPRDFIYHKTRHEDEEQEHGKTQPVIEFEFQPGHAGLFRRLGGRDQCFIGSGHGIIGKFYGIILCFLI